MDERIKREAIHALNEGWDGVLGLMNRWGQVGPYFFRDPEELDKMEVEPRYSLAKTIQLMLNRRPDLRIAAVVRGCDVRALRELEEMGQIKTEGLRLIGITCSHEQAEECNCEKPYYETLNCTGCWKCIDACKEQAIEKINVCPILVPSEYDVALAKRKAIYISYPQAVPLKAMRDSEHCLKITGAMDCKGCETVCQAEAILHEDQEEVKQIEVGSVILAPGFEPYDPSHLDVYGFGKLPNVVTSMQFERILSASGPYGGHLVRPSDRKEPKKIAWLQCVGSRDVNMCGNAYCSSVCCMYAIKEAVVAKEHAGDNLDCAIFYMDMRTFGKDFERFYKNAEEKQGVRFIQSRIHTVDPVAKTDDLEIKFATENGQIKNEIFDLVVLSVGLETPPDLIELARSLDIDLTDGSFCRTSSFSPVATSREGVFVSGAFQNPKDIPQSVIDASAAACAAGEILSPSRHTMIKTREIIPETNVSGDRPRIGVFVCKCGINIAGIVDVSSVRDYAAGLPYVDYVTDNLYTCSQDTQDIMTQTIRDNNLNRIVVAACTPKTHEPLFQETLINAGLNKYLFEMVNIRNQDSWVHKDTPEIATQKAKDLVRMAIAKVALMEPLEEATLDVNQTALVIGGGIAGMASALSLAKQGYEVHLVERDPRLGGQAQNLFKTWKGEDIQEKLSSLIKEVENEANVHVHLDAGLIGVEGFVGNFRSAIKDKKGEDVAFEHGVAIIATGASEFSPDEYLYKKDSRIKTSLELDRMFINDDPSLKSLKTAVFIQCVGSREPDRLYCSRVCCTHSIESALELKKRNPNIRVFILHRDIRTYGERELLYKEARNAGVVFIRYSLDQKPDVTIRDGRLFVQQFDPILGRPVKIETDLLTLATAIIPHAENELAQFFKVPLNDDGFFVERHAKLGPSEFATDGVFLCGMAHYPKSIDESIVQGQAAASRAITLLAKKTIQVSGTVAQVDPTYCSSCGVCVDICPYSAPSFAAEGRFTGRAEINPVLCKGCGLCVASCRSGAINLKGFGTDQIMAMINEV